MKKEKTYLTLKLGPAKQREIFNSILIKRYLSRMGKDAFATEEEKEDFHGQLDDIWEREFKEQTLEFANLSAGELERHFSEMEIFFDDGEIDEEMEEDIEDFERAELAATSFITLIPLRESGFPMEKISFDSKKSLDSMTEMEAIKVKWAYDVAMRVARYAYEKDKEIRKNLRKEIHGLLSAYIPRNRIIPIRDTMIEEYKNGLLIL
jgi:hypothetical protein